MASRLKQFCCPNCGSNLGEAPTLDVMKSQIVNHLKPVLIALYEAGERGLVAEELFTAAWGARVKSDSDFVRVRTYIHQLRKEVEQFGYYIPKNRGRNISVYKLLPIEVGP